MNFIFEGLLNKLGFIILLSYFVTRFPQLKRVIRKEKISWKETIFLSLVFGTIGVMGTYFGIPVHGALANSRVVGVVVGGLLGGPWVGLGAGIIAGGHRWAIDIGGFTAFACAVATISEGLLGGCFSHFVKKQKLKWWRAFIIGIIAEIMQMLIILIIAKPYILALQLVKVIWIPMIIVNALGISLMIAIIESIYVERERIGAHQAQVALNIANKTLPYFRKGLQEESASHAVKIIMDAVDADAVAITDREEILAHVGVGEDHHIAGLKTMTKMTSRVIENGNYVIADTRDQVGCSNEKCKLSSAVIVPLKEKDKVIGTLKLYRVGEQKITTVDVELATGLAQLFSTQLELARLEYQTQLIDKAELKALQAQINPHFLFNALNTIISLVRSNPEKARVLLGNLGDFFRNNLQHAEEMVTLEKEISHVKSYLAIEEARFGDKLKVFYDLPEKTSVKLPPLILQPIVENAVKHGLLPRKNGGSIFIEAHEERDTLVITVKDNGVGMDEDKISQVLSENGMGGRIGISNVNNRLRNVFGAQFGLKINSELEQGTCVILKIPFIP